MVIEYWAAQPDGHAVPVAGVNAILHELYSSREHGIPASAMEQYLRQHGFVAIAFSGNWDDLEQQLKKNTNQVLDLQSRDIEYTILQREIGRAHV